MVTNNFENKSFMHSMRRLSMHTRGTQFFSFGEGGWKRGIFCFFLVLNVFGKLSTRRGAWA
jgi:hypothetical protein